MAASLMTSSTFSSLSLGRLSPLPNHLQQSPASWTLSLSKPLKFRSIKAMAAGEDKVKGGAGDIMDGIKESATDLKSKVSELAGKAADEAGKSKAKSDENVKETASLIADKIDEGISSAAEIAKDVQDKTLGAAETVAEKTEKAVSDAWDAAKGIATKE